MRKDPTGKEWCNWFKEQPCDCGVEKTPDFMAGWKAQREFLQAKRDKAKQETPFF